MSGFCLVFCYIKRKQIIKDLIMTNNIQDILSQPAEQRYNYLYQLY